MELISLIHKKNEQYLLKSSNEGEEGMKEHDNDVITNAVSGSGFRRTRSQAEPDWSVTESLILVNEVAAVEADCSVALSSYQQWNIIAENCAALDVPRSLPQCRRKWRALLNDYDGARGERRALPPGFEREVFEAVERVVRAREERGLVDPESDDEEDGNDEHDATVEIGTHLFDLFGLTRRFYCFWKSDTPNLTKIKFKYNYGLI